MIIINLIIGFLLFWLLLNVLKWGLKWFILYKLNSLHKNTFGEQTHQRQAQQRQTHTVEDHTLIQCAQCGIYIPQTQAIERSKQYYCSKEHLP